MKKTALALLAVVLVFGGCKGRLSGGAGSARSETIAPAESKPAPTTPDAMTQTVDIEDSRTEAEGGVLTDTAASSTNTAAAVKRKTGAAASSRKRPPSQSRPPARTQ